MTSTQKRNVSLNSPSAPVLCPSLIYCGLITFLMALILPVTTVDELDFYFGNAVGIET
jgi:hypothetical protein